MENVQEKPINNLNNSSQVTDITGIRSNTTNSVDIRTHKDRRGDCEHSAWFRAQRCVAAWLLNHKVQTSPAGFYDPFDLISEDGVRIEVKASGMVVAHRPKDPLAWRFNIHRHGLLDEDEVDVYILRCEMPDSLRPVLGKNAIHLVVPAPIGVKTLYITPRSLMTRWGRTFNKISNIKRRVK